MVIKGMCEKSTTFTVTRNKKGLEHKSCIGGWKIGDEWSPLI